MSGETEEKNVKAFLRLIRRAEHGKDDSSVYYIRSGGEKVADTAAHPGPEPIEKWGKKSTAAGAYQILHRTWAEAQRKGIVTDFSPASQDKLARSKLQERRALKYVQEGKVKEAIPLLRSEWTSLPGAKQSKMTMEEACRLFDQYVADQK